MPWFTVSRPLAVTEPPLPTLTDSPVAELVSFTKIAWASLLSALPNVSLCPALPNVSFCPRALPPVTDPETEMSTRPATRLSARIAAPRAPETDPATSIMKAPEPSWMARMPLAPKRRSALSGSVSAKVPLPTTSPSDPTVTLRSPPPAWFLA